MDRHDKSDTTTRPEPGHRGPEVSRRSFLMGSGAAVAAVGVVAVTGACDPPPGEAFDAGITVPAPGTTRDPTPPPPAVRPGGMLRYFTPDEAQTVDAITSRLIPGDANDPGAHEAGVTWYIDADLGSNGGINQPFYAQPPYAMSYEGPQPPANGTYDTLYVPKSEIGRYGPQSSMSPAEQWRAGLSSLDSYAKSKFNGRKFTELAPNEQDSIIDDLAGTSGGGAKDIKQTKTLGGGEMVGSYTSPADSVFSSPSALDFFNLVRDGTAAGMFADPSYGGNRDLVGWKLIKYPGAQRAYTADELRTEGVGTRRAPQSLADLAPFHAGQHVNDQVILPVSGDHIEIHQAP